MTRPTPRVLYLPREFGAQRQRAGRRALWLLAEAGLVEPRVFSPAWHQANDPGGPARGELLRLAAEFQPEVIVFQGALGSGLGPSFWRQLRAVCSATLVYHEPSPARIPLDGQIRAAARTCDLLYLHGAGRLARELRRLRPADLRWTPRTFDPGALSGVAFVAADPTRSLLHLTAAGPAVNMTWRVRRQRAVLRRQLPLAPGLGGRTRSADPAALAGGCVAQAELLDRLAAHQLSLHWDGAPADPATCSVVLPYALASGHVHICGWRPQLIDHLPGVGEFLQLARSPLAAVEIARHWVLEVDSAELDRQRRAARQFANRRLRADQQLVDFLRAAGLALDPGEVESALNSDLSLDV